MYPTRPPSTMNAPKISFVYDRFELQHFSGAPSRQTYCNMHTYFIQLFFTIYCALSGDLDDG
jgi:hypothetical protein